MLLFYLFKDWANLGVCVYYHEYDSNYCWMMLDLPAQQLETLQMDSELLLEIACCGLEVQQGWQVFNMFDVQDVSSLGFLEW